MLDSLSINWTIFRISLEERLVYRGDFALGTLMRFLPVVTQIFLWHAIFSSLGDKAVVAGYTFNDLIAYYLLTMVARAFSSMPGLSSGISEQIRSGEIKKFLIQPIDYIDFLLLGRMAHKAAYYTVATLPFALVFWLCSGYFSGWPSLEVLTAFVISLFLSFLLGFYMETCLGLVGFWFGEVSSLVFVYMLLNFFLSGHMFPIAMLDRLGPFWGTLVRMLPFQYLAYFPSAVFLGKLQGAELWIGVGIELGWVVTFYVLARAMWHYGLRQYSGYGG